MRAQHVIDATSLDADSKETKPALRIVTSYADPSASKRTIRLMVKSGNGLGDAFEFEPRAQTLRTAGTLRDYCGARNSFLGQISLVQPYPHGGINE